MLCYDTVKVGLQSEAGAWPTYRDDVEPAHNDSWWSHFIMLFLQNTRRRGILFRHPRSLGGLPVNL